MNTCNIKEFLKEIDPSFRNNVFAANRLPIRVSLPIYLISNLDPDTMPGSHWVAVYINNNGVGEYFDSFGRKPQGHLEQFLNKNCKYFVCNGKVIQNYLSPVCGMYCLLYIYCRHKSISMYEFINMFCNNTVYNDICLEMMFKDVFKIK